MNNRYRCKGSQFVSSMNIVAAAAMIAVFILAMPEFLSTFTGRIFAGIWAVLAIAIFWAHASQFAEEQRQRRLDRIWNDGRQQESRRKVYRRRYHAKQSRESYSDQA